MNCYIIIENCYIIIELYHNNKTNTDFNYNK